MKPTEMNIDYIHRLIERYFEAEATEAEERELRRLLATTRLESPAIEETRAVMGFYAMGRTGRQRRRLRVPSAAAAAAVAAMIVGGATALCIGGTDAGTDRCIAYVGRTEITDSQRVLSMMRNDLHEIGLASQALKADVASELSTIFQISEL